MKNFITYIILALLLVSDGFSAVIVASDVDPTNMVEQISLIVASVVAFLTFIMGSRRVLKFIG